MEFSYICENLDSCEAFPDGPLVCRPIIAVRIGINGFWTEPIQGVVDTGADYCIFFGNCAEKLGLDLDKLPIAPAQGLGKSILRVAPVDLDTGCLGSWQIRAAFTPNEFPFALLGHVGFLEKFKFSTNLRGSRFTLEMLV